MSKFIDADNTTVATHSLPGNVAMTFGCYGDDWVSYSFVHGLIQYIFNIHNCHQLSHLRSFQRVQAHRHLCEWKNQGKQIITLKSSKICCSAFQILKLPFSVRFHFKAKNLSLGVVEHKTRLHLHEINEKNNAMLLCSALSLAVSFDQKITN